MCAVTCDVLMSVSRLCLVSVCMCMNADGRSNMKTSMLVGLEFLLSTTVYTYT